MLISHKFAINLLSTRIKITPVNNGFEFKS